ncbi:hypothetical protein EYZ11_003784 [Aspergillus tanneri]|uniref:Uncharacterized protein n=1 Tax=Aspergillus tanneri TaxID=1220188 RepID=A0A4S3JMA1_9EURO|nr:hypothetical protein EYZ11_003784 [Aspergillus tanneri]
MNDAPISLDPPLFKPKLEDASLGSHGDLFTDPQRNMGEYYPIFFAARLQNKVVS